MDTETLALYLLTSEMLNELKIAVSQTRAGLKKAPKDLFLEIQHKNLVHDLQLIMKINQQLGMKGITVVENKFGVKFKFLKDRSNENVSGTISGIHQEQPAGQQQGEAKQIQLAKD